MKSRERRPVRETFGLYGVIRNTKPNKTILWKLLNYKYEKEKNE